MRTKILRNRVLATLAFGLLMLGCGETPDPASLLNKTRPLGVRLSVEGDAARTRPEPGETLNITLLMAHRAEERPISYVAAFCIPAATTLGIPFCGTDDEGNPLLVGGIRSGDEVPGDPSFALDIPTEEELAAAGAQTSLLMVAALCQGQLAPITGLANLFESESVNPCSNEADDGAILSTTLTLLRGDEPSNANPLIAGLTLDGMPWDSAPAATDPETGCAGMDLPQVSLSGATRLVVLNPASNARELYETIVDDAPTSVRETLQVTSLATAGEMQRTFTFIEGSDTNASVEWRPPVDGVAANGTRVRFEFVLRDGRGGIDRVRRQLCLTAN